MDASSSQAGHVDPPRHLFFGAEDRRLGGQAGLDDKHLVIERSRRHQLSEHVIMTANQLASSVRTLRAFDRTGSAEMALDHIEATFADLKKYTTNLVNEVQAAADRHGDALDELAARDAAEADPSAGDTTPQTPAAATPTPQALAAAGPKPGPVIHHAVVHVESPVGATPALVQTRKNLVGPVFGKAW